MSTTLTNELSNNSTNQKPDEKKKELLTSKRTLKSGQQILTEDK